MPKAYQHNSNQPRINSFDLTERREQGRYRKGNDGSKPKEHIRYQSETTWFFNPKPQVQNKTDVDRGIKMCILHSVCAWGRLVSDSWPRTLEWDAISYFRDLPGPSDRIRASCIYLHSTSELTVPIIVFNSFCSSYIPHIPAISKENV